jgi:UDP-2,4-diacetamido-2,4,6-trideoxy-beta-L-altropyranose hydrolase
LGVKGESKLVCMFVVFRVDASQKIGFGHVMRCIALALELEELGVTIKFITRNHLGNLNEQIIGNGFEVDSLPSPVRYKSQHGLVGYEKWLGIKQLIDAEETIKLLTNKQPDWLIIDHYALDKTWEKKLKPHTKKIMVIDDLANRKHDCDLLLNQNYIHNKSLYNNLITPDTIKLLGPKYALLRKDFSRNRETGVHSGSINRVLVFFGGSDLENLTAIAIKALTKSKLKHLLVDVVIGSANPNQYVLKKEIAKYPNINLHIQVDNIGELMKEADISLGSGGITTWERMSMGLPSIVVTVAENQVDSIKNLDRDNYLTWIGNADQIDENIIYREVLKAIKNTNKTIGTQQKCQSLINGKGAEIVAKFITIGPDLKTLSIRKATIKDSLLYWHWANDSVVRENSLNQQVIELKNHKAWFKKRLNNTNTTLFLIESDHHPIGQVRFDCLSSNCTINYSLAKQFRKFNLGMIILSKAIDCLGRNHTFTLIGKIRGNNKASIKVFERLGFSEIADKKKCDIHHFELQLTSIKF